MPGATLGRQYAMQSRAPLFEAFLANISMT